jgi:hypothetical protein
MFLKRFNMLILYFQVKKHFKKQPLSQQPVHACLLRLHIHRVRVDSTLMHDSWSLQLIFGILEPISEQYQLISEALPLHVQYFNGKLARSSAFSYWYACLFAFCLEIMQVDKLLRWKNCPNTPISRAVPLQRTEVQSELSSRIKQVCLRTFHHLFTECFLNSSSHPCYNLWFPTPG